MVEKWYNYGNNYGTLPVNRRLEQLIGAYMTKNQRDYLADLAGRKGVQLHDTDNWSVSRASEEIEKLKAMPDAVFDEITPAQKKKIDRMAKDTLAELHKWGFERSES